MNQRVKERIRLDYNNSCNFRERLFHYTRLIHDLLSFFFSTSDGHAGAGEHDRDVYRITESHYELHTGEKNHRGTFFSKSLLEKEKPLPLEKKKEERVCNIFPSRMRVLLI